MIIFPYNNIVPKFTFWQIIYTVSALIHAWAFIKIITIHGEGRGYFLKGFLWSVFANPKKIIILVYFNSLKCAVIRLLFF